jgi:hypothetical protein
MNRVELAVFALMLTAAFAGGMIGHKSFGALGFVAGCLIGGFSIPLCIALLIAIFRAKR